MERLREAIILGRCPRVRQRARSVNLYESRLRLSNTRVLSRKRPGSASMPDWSYRTVFRPLLFRLPARTARDLALGAMGLLARLPWGSLVIDFLGHMRPDEHLERSLLGVRCLSPVGLAGDLDVNCAALRALARFGVGFVEVGPITATGVEGAIERRVDQQACWYPDPPPNPGAAAMRERLLRWGKLPVPLLIRVSDNKAADQLAPLADVLVVTDPEIIADRPRLLAVSPDVEDTIIEAAVAQGIGGVIVDAVQRDGGGRLCGLPAFDAVCRTVRRLRERWGDRLAIIAGGVHQPEHALELRAAGADLVQVSTGLVYCGPGLPKRVNDAWLHAEHGRDAPPPPQRAVEMSWFWTLLMGLGMLGGGLLAL